LATYFCFLFVVPRSGVAARGTELNDCLGALGQVPREGVETDGLLTLADSACTEDILLPIAEGPARAFTPADITEDVVEERLVVLCREENVELYNEGVEVGGLMGPETERGV